MIIFYYLLYFISILFHLFSCNLNKTILNSIYAISILFIYIYYHFKLNYIILPGYIYIILYVCVCYFWNFFDFPYLKIVYWRQLALFSDKPCLKTNWVIHRGDYGIDPWESIHLSDVIQAIIQWEFQDPKMEVPTIYKAYIRPM